MNATSASNDPQPGRLDRLRGKLEAALPAPAAALLGGDGHLGSVFRGAFSVLLVRIVGAALVYASMVLLARWMGAFEFGIYAYVWTWILIFGMPASLGLNSSILRFVPEYSARKRWGRVRGVIRRGYQISALASLGTAAIGALLLWILHPLLDSYYVVPMMIGLAVVPLFAMMDFQEGCARAFGWVGLAYVAPYILRPASLIAIVGLLVLIGLSPDGRTALYAMGAACILALVIQGIVVFRRIAQQVPRAKPRTHTAYWIQVSAPMLVFEAAFLVMSSTDVMMLGQFDTPATVAVYFAAARTAGLVGFVYFATSARGVPKLAEINTTGTPEEMQAFLDGINRMGFWPSLLGAAGLALVGPFVLGFFGEGFGGGYHILVLLTLVYVARTTVGPLEYLLSMTGKQVLATKIIGGAALLNIALNALLIPRLGMTGAALSTLLAMLINFVVLVVVVRRTHGVSAFLFRNLIPLPRT